MFMRHVVFTASNKTPLPLQVESHTFNPVLIVVWPHIGRQFVVVAKGFAESETNKRFQIKKRYVFID